MIPVFALAYGVVLLGEHITLWMLMCGCVIAVGTALAGGLQACRLAGLASAPGG